MHGPCMANYTLVKKWGTYKNGCSSKKCIKQSIGNNN